MKNVANKLQGAVQTVGMVASIKDERPRASITVRTDEGEFVARRAVSCLVAPEVGDMVLLSVVERAGCYVLAVLEREDSDGDTTLAVDGDLHLNLRSGKFTVAAQEGIDLASAKDVSVVSQGVSVKALEGNVMLDKLSYLGRFMRSEIDKVKSIAGTVDSVMERLSQRVKRSYRHVEELDQLKAERVDYAAKQMMRLHGEHMVVTANELVKMDGEQIHLG